MLKVAVITMVLFLGLVLAPNIEAAAKTIHQLVRDTLPAPASYTDAIDRLEVAIGAAESFVAQGCPKDNPGISWVVIFSRLGAEDAAERAWQEAESLSDFRRSALAALQVRLDFWEEYLPTLPTGCGMPQNAAMNSSNPRHLKK